MNVAKYTCIIFFQSCHLPCNWAQDSFYITHDGLRNRLSWEDLQALDRKKREAFVRYPLAIVLMRGETGLGEYRDCTGGGFFIANTATCHLVTQGLRVLFLCLGGESHFLWKGEFQCHPFPSQHFPQAAEWALGSYQCLSGVRYWQGSRGLDR